MECREYHKYFNSFINNELDYKETRELLLHVSQCKDCDADLHSQYIMISGLRKIDLKEGDPPIPEYEELIKQETKRCRREGIIRRAFVELSILALIISVIFVLKGILWIN